MEKKIQFELVLRAKDTTVHDEKTGFHIVEELVYPLEADWNTDTPDLPPAALMAMTRLDMMIHGSKHYIDKIRSAPVDVIFVSLLEKVTEKLRPMNRPATCPHGRTIANGCHDCFVDENA